MGGENPKKEKSRLRKGCTILVCTPGRFLYHLKNTENIKMDFLQYLIIDEADRMLDMGFEPQIREIIYNYGLPDKYDRQTLMFSATFPKEIQMLATEYLKDYLLITSLNYPDHQGETTTRRQRLISNCSSRT